MPSVRRAGAALLGTLVLLAQPAAPSTAIGAAPQPRTHVVVIDKMKFGPVPAGVKAGDTILWVNKDLFRHSATTRNRSFDVDLPPSSRGKMVVKRAGAIDFYCRYHPGMKGVLNVS